jgi:hypothetical protein
MTASTLTLTPGPSDLDRPGVGATAEPPAPHFGLGLQVGLVARAGDPGYAAWLAHVMPAAACSHPIRLRVEAEWHTDTGDLVTDPVSSTMPDRELYVRVRIAAPRSARPARPPTAPTCTSSLSAAWSVARASPALWLRTRVCSSR